MMQQLRISFLVLLLTHFFYSGLGFGQNIQPPPPPPPPEIAQAGAPVLQMISPGIFEIGGCRIIKEKGTVEFPAVVNMNEGLLEYLLVENSGKVHESLLRTEVAPYSLQLSLLLVGLEGTSTPLNFQGENSVPQGDMINIWLVMDDKGKEVKIPIEKWVTKNKEEASQIPWVFTGSVIHDGVFMAQIDKSIIAVFHDPVALIDHQLQEGASDEVWMVNSSKTPQVGTKVTVVIEKKK